MSYPLRNCHRCGKDFFSSYHEHICPECLHELGWEPTPYSNAEHIRNMSDEELKVYLCYISDCAVCLWQSSSGCKLEDWLKQPYEGATE